jgi:hypothetical protein
VVLMTTTHVSTVTFLEALSWPIPASPTLNTGENPRTCLRIKRRQRDNVVFSLEALLRLFVVSLVHPLELVVATIRARASGAQLTPLSVLLGRRLIRFWFGPTVQLPTLRLFRAGSALTWVIIESESIF